MDASAFVSAAVVSPDADSAFSASSPAAFVVSASAEAVVCGAVSLPAPDEHPNRAAAIQIDSPIDNTFFMLCVWWWLYSQVCYSLSSFAALL